jgi:hypothetical protein
MLSTANAAAVASQSLPESPYRGIESFRYVDQPIFFAREEETRRLLRYVSVYRGVLFYGESGCGKSSLVNAGFIPAVIAEGFTPDRLRVQPKPGEEIVVERISTKDSGEAPYLPSNFIRDEETASRLVLSADQLKERLKKLCESSPGRRPLLIFDQFEEFSTLFEEAPRAEGIEQARRAQKAILNAILDVQRDGTLPVKMLFSFREDYLAKLSKLIALWPDLSDQSQRLTPPSKESLPTIIRGSFEKYPGSFGKELSPTLTSELTEALEVRNEGGKLNLSEVQIACLQLWKSKDPEALFKQKGVQGLLEDYLSDSLNRLGENLRDPAVALLSRMVTPSGTRNIVSEYDLIGQVQEDEGISEERLKDALRALVQDTKLVRRERRYDTYFYDIVSEFLVPWIRAKKVERLAALERQKLEATEKRKRRRVLIVAAASLLVTLAVGLAALYYIRFQRQKAYSEILKEQTVRKALDERNAARDAAELAVEQRRVAEEARAAAQRDANTLTMSLLEAQQAYATAQQKLTASEQARAKSDAQLAQLKSDYDKFKTASSSAVNNANDLANKQAMEVYGSLKDVYSKLNKICAASGGQRANNDASAGCNQIKEQIYNATMSLRRIGKPAEGR